MTRQDARRWLRRTLAAGCAAAWIVAAGSLAAQDTPVATDPAPATSASAGSAAAAGSPLVIYNRTIFVFRAPFLGVSPAARARIAHERIVDVLDRPGAIATGVEPAPQGAIVRVDGVFGFVVTPADVDALTGETPVEGAQRAAKVLDVVIAETREARDGHAMLVALGLAVLATVICIALLWALGRVRRALGARFLEATARHAERVQVGGVALLQRDRARDWARRGVNALFWALALIVAYQWLGYVLGRFPYTRPWGERLTAFLIDTVRDMVEGIAHALPGLAIALVIFLIARGVARAVDALLQRVQLGQVVVGWLDADTARPTRRLMMIVIWAFALVMAYPYLPGSSTEAFKGMSVLIGLMVSLGASSVIAQGASGLILMYTRTLRPGEFVRIGDHQGVVVELTMFATRIRDGHGVELTLPSALVLGAVTRNYSRPAQGGGVLVEVDVTVGYDVPWRQVHAMLLEAAHRAEGVLDEPPPRVYQSALSDFYVAYQLVCQAVPSEPRPQVLSALHARVQDVFNEHGVQIMSPHYQSDPATEKVVPPQRWFATPANRSDS